MKNDKTVENKKNKNKSIDDETIAMIQYDQKLQK